MNYECRSGGDPGFAWDDYMDHAIEDSLDFAMPFPEENNKLILTAYPSDNSSVSDCVD